MNVSFQPDVSILATADIRRIAADACTTIASGSPLDIAASMTDDLTTIILGAIERAPQWIRRDLDSKDRVVRIQAEESLAAMIADALRKTDELPT